MANINNGDGVISYETALRAIVSCVTLLAAVVASIDQKTSTIAVTDYWFLAMANAMASAYLAGSMIYSVMYHHKKVHTVLPFLVPDTIIMAILFASANMAARVVGFIGISGYSIVISHFGCFISLMLPIISLLSIREDHMN